MTPASGSPRPPVPATLSIEEAAAEPWDAVIVGAGPAGAAAGVRLARMGLRALLVDRDAMPRWKVCGCCLSVAAVDELRLLRGAVDQDRGLPLGGLPLEAVRLAADGSAARMPLPGGAVLSREALDATLVLMAIEAGCHWLPHLNVISFHDDRDAKGRVSIAVRPQNEGGAVPACLRTGLCVLATGLSGNLRTTDTSKAVAGSRIGLGTSLGSDTFDLPEGELVIAVADQGYCGLVRLEDGRIDVAAAVDRRSLTDDPSPAAALHRLLSQALGTAALPRGIRERLTDAAFRATPPLTRSSPTVCGSTGRILRVGDAAGYIEPFTGEGIGWALASARLLADSLSEADSAARYRIAHRRHFGPLHARCRRVAIALRRPVVVKAALRAARIAPWAAKIVVPGIIGASRSARCRGTG